MVENLRPYCEVLLVEDSDADVFLARAAFRQAGVHCNVNRTRDGVEALRFLRHEGPYAGAPRPDLILLDLNMPRMGGREFLAVVKQDTTLRRIPVVMLTMSRAPRDVLQAYQLQTNCYVVKPVDYNEFVEVVRRIGEFWLGTVQLPPVGDESPGR